MTLEELKAQHPAVYKAAFEEGKAAGVVEGKKFGIDEGKSAGIAEGKAAENKRIQAIEEIAIPGAETVVAAAKKDINVSAEQTAALILKDQKTRHAALAAGVLADGAAAAALAAQLAPANNVAPTGDAAAKAEVDASIAKLKAMQAKK
jgi:hypothetical protein